MEEPNRLATYELHYAPSPPREPTPSWPRRIFRALSGAAASASADPRDYRQTLRATSTHATPQTHYEFYKRVPERLLPADQTTWRCEYSSFSVVETSGGPSVYQRAKIDFALFEIPRSGEPIYYLEIVDRLVEPEMRRGGIGAQLLAIAEDVAGRNGCELIWGHLAPSAGLSERTLRGHHRVRGYEIHERVHGATLVIKRRPREGWARYEPLGGASWVRDDKTAH